MNEKFTISLEVVVGSKNRQQLNNLSNSLRQSNKESQNTTKSLNEMTNKLNNIKNMSFANVIQAISGSSKSIKAINSQLAITIGRMGKLAAISIKDSFSNFFYIFKDFRKNLGYGMKDSLAESANTSLGTFSSHMGRIKGYPHAACQH